MEKLHDVRFPEGTVISIAHSTSSAKTNPNGPWTVKGVIRIDISGETVETLVEWAARSLKITRQNVVRPKMTAEQAKAELDRTVRLGEVGRSSRPFTPEQYREWFKGLSPEEQKAELERLQGK